MSNPGETKDDFDLAAPKSGTKRLSSMNMMSEMKKAESMVSLEKSPSKTDLRRSRLLNFSSSRRNLNKSDSLFQSLGNLRDQVDTMDTEFRSTEILVEKSEAPVKPQLGRKVSMFKDKFELEIPLAQVNKQLPKSVEMLANQAIPKKIIQTLTEEEEALASIESLDINELLSTYDKPDDPALKRQTTKVSPSKDKVETLVPPAPAAPVAPPPAAISPRSTVKRSPAESSPQTTPAKSLASSNPPEATASLPPTVPAVTLQPQPARAPTLKQSGSQETRPPRTSLFGRPSITGPSLNRVMNNPQMEEVESSPERKKTGIKFFDRLRGIGSVEEADSPKSVSSSSDSSPVKGSILNKSKRMTTATLADSKKTGRSFKDWYTTYLQESKLFGEVIKAHRSDDGAIPELFKLKGFFGLGIDSTIPLLWSARDYEKLKLDPIWNEQKMSPVYERAVSPNSPRSPEDDDEEINFRILNIFKDAPLDNVFYELNEDGAPSSFVLQGKPFDLVDALIFPLTQDKQYAETFLYSYRFFMPGVKVLDALVQWYFVDVSEDCEPDEEAFLRKNRRAIQSRVAKVLLLWIKNIWQDFQDDPSLFCGLLKFIDQISDLSFGDSQKLTQAVREQVRLYDL